MEQEIGGEQQSYQLGEIGTEYPCEVQGRVSILAQVGPQRTGVLLEEESGKGSCGMHDCDAQDDHENGGLEPEAASITLFGARPGDNRIVQLVGQSRTGSLRENLLHGSGP